jgi:radical SAM superfamily enzyme YgiQ (UPF0313 family)
MATLLRHRGHEVRVWDPLPGDRAFIREIADFSPALVGVGFLTACFERARDILADCREALPWALRVIGGPHTSALPAASLEALDAHVAVVGEGEWTLLELMERISAGEAPEGVPGTWLRVGDTCRPQGTRAPVEDLDALPFPDRGLLSIPYNWYLAPPGVLRGLYRPGTTTLIAGRGCPHRCVFCASHVVGGRRPRRRSVGHVLEEIRELRARYAVRGLWFLDDDLALDPAWLGELCEALGPLGLEWSMQARLDRLEGPLLRALAGAGCVQVELGLESGSDRILAELRKGCTAREVEARVASVRAAGIRVMANFLLGSPGETRADLEATLALAERIRPDFVEFNVCMPYPGSALYERLVTGEAPVFGERWSEHFTRDPILRGELDGTDLMRVRAAAQNRSLARNYGPIARGFLGDPGRWPALGRALIRTLLEERERVADVFRGAQIDPLLWAAYARWSAQMRGTRRRSGVRSSPR